MAQLGRGTHSPGRQLSGKDWSRQPVVGAAVHDPEGDISIGQFLHGKMTYFAYRRSLL
jgi:hypothetical protein